MYPLPNTHETLLNDCSNPKLGGLVRVFKNQPAHKGIGRGITFKIEEPVLIGAARNMTGLKETRLAPSVLAAHILAELQSYPRIENLHVSRLDPEKHIWSNAPCSLKTLRWDMENDFDMQLLIKFAEATCPNLESLDLHLVKKDYPYSAMSAPQTVPSQTMLQYPELLASETASEVAPLKRLRHLGLSYNNGQGNSMGRQS
jgi:hypothetical protein